MPCEWNNDNIIVLETIIIKAPYGEGDIAAITNDGRADRALGQVKRVVSAIVITPAPALACTIGLRGTSAHPWRPDGRGGRATHPPTHPRMPWSRAFGHPPPTDPRPALGPCCTLGCLIRVPNVCSCKGSRRSSQLRSSLGPLTCPRPHTNAIAKYRLFSIKKPTVCSPCLCNRFAMLRLRVTSASRWGRVLPSVHFEVFDTRLRGPFYGTSGLSGCLRPREDSPRGYCIAFIEGC